MEEYWKSIEIYDWMNLYENYKNGVTNEQVISRFGSNYLNSWKKLKSNKKLIFFEDGKRHRWNN